MATLISSRAGKNDLPSFERPLRLLIVDDTPQDAELILACLKSVGYVLSFDVVPSPEQFQERIEQEDYDLIICDHNLRTWTGLDALEMLHRSQKDIPFVVVTGTLGDEAAAGYIKLGAADYILKHRLNLLPLAVGHVLKEKSHRDEEKRLHEHILSSKREWESTFDSVQDAVLIVDNQGHIQRCNRALSEILGIPLSELVGRPGHEVLSTLVEAPSGSPHAPWRTKLTLHRHDFAEPSLERIYDVSTTPLRNNEGAALGSIYVLRDVSEQHRTEQDLHRSVDRYRSLVIATAQVVWSTNPAGEVIEDLPLWREFTGKSAGETLGRGWLNGIHPEDRERALQAWSNAVKNHSSYGAQFRVLRSDGEYRDLLARGVPVLEDDGSVREWVGTCTDVTDQRRLEEQFRQAQKMEAMGKLAGGIAHDFNNILGVIIGYSDLLLSSMHPVEEARRKVEQIKKAGQRAASLTLQLLAFSRKQVLAPKILDLNTVVREISKMLLRLIGEHIELATNLSPTLYNVRADPTQIEQVLINLAVNARDSMPKGGKLTIETLNVELDQLHGRQFNVDVEPGSYVLLSVSDTGVGMDKKIQARVFEPFFTTKKRGEGTGLGLATVYGIVKQSGGYIWIYSEVGKGTTVKVYLPRIKETVTEDKSEEGPPLPLGSGTILLVEDEESLREISHKLLESMGYTVIEAANGADAIRTAGQCADQIQLLVTDVVMPGMSGRELAELLVANHPKMRVLYVSGYTDDVILHYSTLEHGVAFLQKPVTRDTFAKKIQEALAASNG